MNIPPHLLLTPLLDQVDSPCPRHCAVASSATIDSAAIVSASGAASAVTAADAAAVTAADAAAAATAAAAAAARPTARPVGAGA